MKINLENTDKSGKVLLEKLARDKEVKEISRIPSLDPNAKNSFLQMSGGHVDLNMIQIIARDIFDISKNKEDIKQFPSKAILLSTLVQIIALEENKCSDKKLLNNI